MEPQQFDQAAVAHIEQALAHIQASHPDDPLDRLRELIAGLGASGSLPRSSDPRHQPMFYYPGIDDTPVISLDDPDIVEVVATLEANFELIRDEMLSALETRSGFVPYVTDEAREVDPILGDQNVFHLVDAFAAFPERLAHNRSLCPKTVELVESLPRAGEIAMFSALTTGTHLSPHCGAENLRRTVHLPLVVPEGCSIQVLDHTHVWEAGRVFAFNDSYEHQAWNRSDRTRTILLLDLWNPRLSPGEIAFFELVGPALNRVAIDEDFASWTASLDGKTWWT